MSGDSAVRRSDTVYPAELNDRSLGALNQSAAVADTVDVVLFAIAFRCALNHRRRKMFRPGGGQGRSQDCFSIEAKEISARRAEV